MTVDDWSVGMCRGGKVQFATEQDARWFVKRKGWRTCGRAQLIHT